MHPDSPKTLSHTLVSCLPICESSFHFENLSKDDMRYSSTILFPILLTHSSKSETWDDYIYSRQHTYLHNTLSPPLTYNFENFSINQVYLTARKILFLVYRINTDIISWPIFIFGKLVTKSMMILSHFHYGTSSGSMSINPLVFNFH